MDLTQTLSFDYGNIYAFISNNTNTGQPEYLVKMKGIINIIATIDITGDAITPTPLFPKLSYVELLHMGLIMSLIQHKYKQLQTP